MASSTSSYFTMENCMGKKKINLGKMANKHVSSSLKDSTAPGNVSVGRVKHSYNAPLYKQSKFLGSNKRNYL